MKMIKKDSENKREMNTEKKNEKIEYGKNRYHNICEKKKNKD